MRIDIPDAAPEQGLTLDEMQYLGVRGDGGLRQLSQGVENHLALPQSAERQLAGHERVAEDLCPLEQPAKRIVAGAQMVDPDGGIDQDQRERGRRRGIDFRFGSLPPRRAKRRALSRSINALSASRTRADFSRTPV
jgi:hypothetical protein